MGVSRNQQAGKAKNAVGKVPTKSSGSADKQNPAPKEASRKAVDSLLHVGQRIEARWDGREQYYPGKIAMARSGGTFDVDYDDGDFEERVPARFIRSWHLAQPPRVRSPAATGRSTSVAAVAAPAAAPAAAAPRERRSAQKPPAPRGKGKLPCASAPLAEHAPQPRGCVGEIAAGEPVEVLYERKWWPTVVHSTDPFIVIFDDDGSELQIPRSRVELIVRRPDATTPAPVAVSKATKPPHKTSVKPLAASSIDRKTTNPMHVTAPAPRGVKEKLIAAGEPVEVLYERKWWPTVVQSTDPFIVVFDDDGSELQIPRSRVELIVRRPDATSRTPVAASKATGAPGQKPKPPTTESKPSGTSTELKALVSAAAPPHGEKAKPFTAGEPVEVMFGKKCWQAVVQATDPFFVVFDEDGSELSIPSGRVANIVRRPSHASSAPPLAPAHAKRLKSSSPSRPVVIRPAPKGSMKRAAPAAQTPVKRAKFQPPLRQEAASAGKADKNGAAKNRAATSGERFDEKPTFGGVLPNHRLVEPLVGAGLSPDAVFRLVHEGRHDDAEICRVAFADELLRQNQSEVERERLLRGSAKWRKKATEVAVAVAKVLVAEGHAATWLSEEPDLLHLALRHLEPLDNPLDTFRAVQGLDVSRIAAAMVTLLELSRSWTATAVSHVSQCFLPRVPGCRFSPPCHGCVCVCARACLLVPPRCWWSACRWTWTATRAVRCLRRTPSSARATAQARPYPTACGSSRPQCSTFCAPATGPRPPLQPRAGASGCSRASWRACASS